LAKKSNSPREKIVIGYAQKAPRLWKLAKGENSMKESALARITAAATAAKITAQKALASDPNPEWTEHEMQSIDDWIRIRTRELSAPRLSAA
jgi:hypothetical protein